MANIIEEHQNKLSPLDYESILKNILKQLEKDNPFKFSEKGDRLRIDLDQIAYQVATSKKLSSPLTSTSGVRSASINFNSTEQFAQQIRQIAKRLEESLKIAVGEHQTVETAISKLISNLSTFKQRETVGFTYPFTSREGLQKERLSLQRHRNGSDSLLKCHKLTLTVEEIHKFSPQLQKSLENYINTQFQNADEDDLEELNEILEDQIKDQKSDFHNLRQVMDTEAVGKLKREAKIKYLEFIRSHLNPNQNHGVYLLDDLIRRLRLMEDFLNDPEKDDGYYQLNYEGTTVNYRDLFARAEALDILPIIPIIEGNLGETTDIDSGERQFIWGLKLKFGGTVQAYGEQKLPVLDYYLNLLDPDSEEHKQGIADPLRGNYFKEKVLKIVFLYCFIFGSKTIADSKYNLQSELDYNPTEFFENKVLPVFKSSDEAQKAKLLKAIKTGFLNLKVENKVERLKQVLQNFLKQKKILNKQDYQLQIGVKRGLLALDCETVFKNQSFFDSVFSERGRKALKYITIQEPHVDSNYLCTLPVKISFEDIRYYPTEDRQSFSMEYDISNLKTLPIVIASLNNDNAKKTYEDFIKKRNLILLTYNHNNLQNNIFKNPDSPEAFFYRVAFSLLTYIALKTLLKATSERLFLPILRLHLKNHSNSCLDEEFLRSLSKIIAHLLSENHLSNSQGIKISNLKYESYRVKNALSSLYSVIPKNFQFETGNTELKTPSISAIDKLAIIIVSSRESDASFRSDQKISNLLGEVITIQRLENGKVHLETHNTFSANYEHQQMFQSPQVVIDQVSKLYIEGYRHFMYIAKTPYTSTLNLTQSLENDSLFFMSSNVIKSLKGNKTDLKIYPVFFDKYYVVNWGGKESSLYIQDTTELTNLVDDPSKKTVVFFNLFNGKKVGKDERFYNGVISYSTLLNIYNEGILDDQDIRLGLIYDQTSDQNNNPLKNEILQFLTLLHFSRYEQNKTTISLKLDPYENVIGDDSVSALSIFTHISKKTRFNLLAFLTEVRRALNV
ncbi:hypothetical protein ACL6C3_27575 [Capilliphycus salinus ALCB114379]|uniref:hypothetical protein n=1 Tax=Capilliphycus salinus TaxID=2768948 RepID=UPI0039A4D7B8